MSKSFNYCCFIAVLSLLVGLTVVLPWRPSAAAIGFRKVIIELPVEVSFSPESAFLLTDAGGPNLKKFRALLVPPLTEDESSTAKSVWQVGAEVEVPASIETIKFSVLLIGREDQRLIIVGQTLDLSAFELSAELNVINGHIAKRAEVLHSWQAQASAQETTLKRLRAEADMIANVGRIVDVLDQVEAKKYGIENIDKDIQNLHELLAQAKVQPAPKNYARRELDLTKQIADLVLVVKDAERNEPSRLQQSQSDLKRKITIVEATRHADEEKLKAKLVALRTRRVKLEHSEALRHGGEGANYWDSQ